MREVERSALEYVKRPQMVNVGYDSFVYYIDLNVTLENNYCSGVFSCIFIDDVIYHLLH